MPRPNRGPYLKFLRERSAFYIFWSEAGVTRKRSTGTADRGAAETSLGEFLRERQISCRPAGPASPAQYPIASAIDLYGTLHAPHTADPARIAYAMTSLLDFWGELNVDAVTKQTCRAYGLWRKRSPGTVRRELGTLKAALNFAHQEGRLTSVPVVHLPDRPEGRERWLTKNEAARLLNAARNSRGDVRLYLPLFVLLGLYTGARPGAILSLRWQQVDLEKRRIYFGPPGERRTSKRKVHGQPISRRLLTFLKLARKRGTDLGYVVHIGGRRIRDIGGSWSGDPSDRGHGSFGAACRRAGVINASPHTLRHTCATWLAQRGVPLHLIGGWIGHQDARTTALYAHHHPDHMAEALRAVDRR
jgi:integrase